MDSKTRKIILISAACVLAIGLLFVFRNYVLGGLGVWGATDTYSIVRLDTNKIQVLENALVTPDGAVALKDEKNYGFAAGWAAERSNYLKTLFRPDFTLSNGCGYVVKVKLCADRITDCPGEWQEIDPKRPPIFNLVIPSYAWFGLTILPCR